MVSTAPALAVTIAAGEAVRARATFTLAETKDVDVMLTSDGPSYVAIDDVVIVADLLPHAARAHTRLRALGPGLHHVEVRAGGTARTFAAQLSVGGQALPLATP